MAYLPAAVLLAVFIVATVIWLAGPVVALQAFAAASGTALLGLLARLP